MCSWLLCQFDPVKDTCLLLSVLFKPCIHAGCIDSHLAGIQDVAGSTLSTTIGEPEHFQRVLATRYWNARGR